MIQDVCRVLKEKRKELGYSLEYVVEKTKLHPSVIKDIESGNLNKISPAYLRGFMKIYVSFLGVDAKAALDEIETQEPAALASGVTASASRETVKNIAPLFKKYLLAVIIGVVIIWTGFAFLRFALRGLTRIFRPAAEAKQDISETESFSFPEGKQLQVSLTAKKKCFVRVVVDGKLLFEGVINKGALESWQAAREIEFKISDGSAIYLEVNGKPIPTLTSIHKPIKSLKITPSGISVDK
jgi:cytoskeletal protein RodZ